ncbi:MAG: hypothetical protein Q8O00_11810 [Holophaga sp.]|nr:hypothetical protein [Holophaga sp.]
MPVLAQRGELYATEASHRDVFHVALRLRLEDWRDAEAICDAGPRQAVWMTAWSSLWVTAVRRRHRQGQDLTLAIFGVAPSPMPGTGVPWMLSASEFFDHPRALARYSREFVGRMLERYDVLTNWVDIRNVVSVRWLGWCGFKIMETVPFGPHGLPFHRVEMRRPS